MLDVDNPNNVVGDDILLPSAAQPLANGALFELQDGYAYIAVVYSTASDELHWVGSRDAYQQLNFGHFEWPDNEFINSAFMSLAPARWMTDKAIEVLEMHLADGVLADQSSLAEAYLWGALTYGAIADAFDDFTFSDMMVAGPPIGDATNSRGDADMTSLYQDAIGYMTSGLALSGLSSDLQRNMTANRARLRHGLGVWNLVGQRPISTGLISGADASAAAAFAAEALALDNSDWTYSLEYFSGGTRNDVGQAVNSRLEMRFGNRYITPTANDKERDRDAADRGIVLQDPIDGVGDPRLDAFMTPFEDDEQYANLPVLSAREMHLILAEDALVRGDDAAFATNINQPRAWGGMSDWTAASGVSQLDILIYERQVNLYLMMRRIGDMYRFQITGDMWQAHSTSITAPGTFFPISKAEIDANCFINPAWPAGVPCGEDTGG